MKRISFIPNLIKNPLSYYSYDLQDGDTPDIVANKYYGNSYRYWLSLQSNQTIDPQWDWPLDSNAFDRYMADKYFVAAGSVIDTNTGKASIPAATTYAQETVYQYLLTTKTVDNVSMKTSVTTIVVDEDTYNSTTTGTTTKTFSEGGSVTQTITKTAQSIYEYEVELNDKKKTISLVNSIYAPQIENQFISLMRL
jgi:hypothetical protein